MLPRPHWLSVFASVLSLLLASSVARAATAAAPTLTAPHLSVTLLVPPGQIYPGESFTAGLDFRMEPGWHVYWINAGDSGEPPTVQWHLPAGVTADPLEFPPPKRLPLGPLMDFGYENEVVFPVPMNVAAGFHPAAHEIPIAAHVSWLVCREVCIPGKGDLAVRRMALAKAPANPTTDTTAQSIIQHFQDQLPQPLPASDAAHFRSAPKGFFLDITTGGQIYSAQFFPLDQNILANAAPQPVKALPDGVQLTLAKDPGLTSPPAQLNGLVELPGNASFIVHATPGAVATTTVAASTSAGDLAGIAGLAFLGGMLLNLMPCVFPVLFIKGLALVQSGQHERHRLRAHGWVYTLGILASFWVVVAVLLSLRAAGRQLGWGFQFQSPVFVALMAMLLFFLGLALAGQFEIGLSLTSAGGSLAQKQGYAGSFFTGVLAMVVATPCTAPFMGAAIGYALSHSAIVSFVVFTALALGLAVPYLALAYFPGWARLLPKPGAWMEVLKQAVSVPIFATVIWLVWVFLRVAGTGLSLMALLVAFLLLAIAGWFLGRWPGRTGPAVIAALVIAAAIAVPISILRAMPPPRVYTAAVFSNGDQGTPVSQLQAPGSAWEPFTPERLADLRAQHRAVFIDFTASWCLSCQVNERLILDRPEVRNALRESGAALLRADWTDQNPAITQELASLGRSGVPTYVLYPPDPSAPPHVLPEVLTPGIVLDALSALPKPQTASAGPHS